MGFTTEARRTRRRLRARRTPKNLRALRVSVVNFLFLSAPAARNWVRFAENIFRAEPTLSAASIHGIHHRGTEDTEKAACATHTSKPPCSPCLRGEFSFLVRASTREIGFVS